MSDIKSSLLSSGGRERHEGKELRAWLFFHRWLCSRRKYSCSGEQHGCGGTAWTPALQHSSPPCSPPLLPVLSAPFPSCTCTPGWSCGSPCSVQVNRGHQCTGTFPEPHHAWCEEQILHKGSGDSQVSPGATLVPVLLYKPSTGVGGHQPPQGCPAMTDPRPWFSQG